MLPKLFTAIFISSVFLVNAQTKKATKTQKARITSHSDIRTLPDSTIIAYFTNKEYTIGEGEPKYGIRIYSDGTFSMYFANHKNDGYSDILKTSLRNGYDYRKMVSGTFTIYTADSVQMGRGVFNQPEKNDFGEIQPVFIYIKYFIVFKGKDEENNTYNMCTRLYQLFDHAERDNWYLGFTNKTVEDCNCRCVEGNGKNREVWIDGFYL